MSTTSSSDDEEWDEIEPNSNENIPTSVETESNLDKLESVANDMEITISLGKPKKSASKEDRQLQLIYHKSMLLSLLASCLFRNNISNNTELQAKLVSLVPFDILESDFNRERKRTKRIKFPRQLCALVDWFHSEAKFTHHFIEYNTIRALSKPDLLNGLSRECACIYFLALLRSLSFNARLVASLTTFSRTISKNAKRLAETVYPIDFFVDVLIDDEWITIDVLSGSIGEVTIKDPLYVIAIANIPLPPFVTIKDITRKFTDKWSVVVKKRAEDWWNQTLWLFSPDSEAIGPQELKENKVLLEMEASEKMPTTLGSFKNHPLFVLERHLNQNEGIYPKEKENSVGIFKNELVYPRELVHILYASEKWKRLGRAVPTGTIPFKTILVKKTETEKHLFGRWQTVDWIRPTMRDGKIPTNEFGNIEIFHENLVPLECVHIRGESAKKAAQQLDIEFARACIDFEHKKGRSFPLFDGIVVEQIFEEIIKIAMQENIQEEAEAARAKKESKVLQAWKRIIIGALLYDRLKKDYAS